MNDVFQYLAEGLLLILGAAIAGIVGMCLNYHREKYREEASIKQFATFIYDDLKRSEFLYAEILKYKNPSDIYYLECIDDFFASRDMYEKIKDRLTVFANEDLRDKIYSYYRDSFTYMKMMQRVIRGLQKLNDDHMGTGDEFTKHELDEWSDSLVDDLKDISDYQLAAKNLLEDIKPYV